MRYMGVIALVAVFGLALGLTGDAKQGGGKEPDKKPPVVKSDKDKLDQIIKMLEEMQGDAKATRKDVAKVKSHLGRLEQDVEKLKKPVGKEPEEKPVVVAKGTESAKLPLRPPQVSEYSSYVVLGGKGRVDEGIDTIFVAQGKEQGPAPAKKEAKEAVVEVKNNWSNEVTLLLNDKKYKVPGKDTKSIQVEPGQFTYQIEGVTEKLTRTVKPGERFSIIVRSTEETTPSKEKKEDSPPPPSTQKEKDTGTLVLTSKLSYSTTVVVNKKQYVVAPGQTVRVEVPAGKVRSNILGSSEIITTDCVPGGTYSMTIQPDTRNQQPRYFYPPGPTTYYYQPGPTYYYPGPTYFPGGCGR